MHHNASTRAGAPQEPHIEVWNDLVSARDLVLSLAVCAACAGGALTVATLAGGQLLFWGLGGSVLGFALSCLLVRPKRDVSIIETGTEVSTETGEPNESPGSGFPGPTGARP
ncbi:MULTISPECIES: hypothetical protein [unclassified Actinomyces]|uniref:hypothetical protein n=1 Tax=unclassified Actinomyces TaxID=2609248 RepID=UPI00201741D4|nr:MULTISPECIES: hypothetical protein [unclassified Actinomyces]MCL3778574.1 hypothetical protein [Actinomyces sp. AC-20-1]MCL3789599.1 hypothetical protein [Actinomyces sp. 187325]MCL3792240.1 hypothetical protein [Actinomyces sp. 186855]MCL3794530.1 hypothetical protein [Actinomyces sp. 217892]